MADELEHACTSYLTSVLRGTSRKHDGTAAVAPEDEADAEQEADIIPTLHDNRTEYSALGLGRRPLSRGHLLLAMYCLSEAAEAAFLSDCQASAASCLCSAAAVAKKERLRKWTDCANASARGPRAANQYEVLGRPASHCGN